MGKEEKQSMTFAFDFQELMHDKNNHEAGIKATISFHKDKINIINSEEQTIVFKDGSKATWYGSGWKIE